MSVKTTCLTVPQLACLLHRWCGKKTDRTSHKRYAKSLTQYGLVHGNRDSISRSYYIFPQSSNGSSVVTIKGASSGESGSYTCEASNGVTDAEGKVIVDTVAIQIDVTGWLLRL